VDTLCLPESNGNLDAGSANDSKGNSSVGLLMSDGGRTGRNLCMVKKAVVDKSILVEPRRGTIGLVKPFVVNDSSDKAS
jgi:hypothetical protein